MLEIKGTEFRSDPIAVLERIDAHTLRLSQNSIDGVPCLYLNDPDLIAAVLETHWPAFRKEFGYKKSRDLIQSDLFSPLTIWPTAQEFASISSAAQEIISDSVFEAGDHIVDLYAWCRGLTMKIFLRTLLNGCVLPGVSHQELEDATMRVIGLLGEVILRFPVNIDSVDKLEIESDAEFRAYSRLFQQDAICEHATPGRAMTTILAGYEQMASIMYWLIFHYVEHPMTQMSGIGHMQYLNEIIRLHQPIWTIMRRPKRAVRLDDFVLPKNCVVITSPWLMARSKTYFPEPGEFAPERWNESVEQVCVLPVQPRTTCMQGGALCADSNVCFAQRTHEKRARDMRIGYRQSTPYQRQCDTRKED